ncbi:MAG: hypothetical protein UHI81_07465 [Olegusella sp.]|nr:hypothetical protein [Olegusella sp.]
MHQRLNLHIDEAGTQDLTEGMYLVTVVLHDHSHDIERPIKAYENRLKLAGLPDIPFHGKDLLHGHEAYENVSVGDRKRLLTQFARLARSLPVTFFTLRYDVHETHDRTELEARIRRDLASLIFDHLSYFQQFDTVSVYYDDGQRALSTALHAALEFVLANNVAVFRDADHATRRLLQLADYICTVERVGLAYDAGRQTKTQERFFGNRRNLMQSYMKQLSQMRFSQ